MTQAAPDLDRRQRSGPGVWHRLKRDRWAVASLFLLVVVGIIAVIGPFIAPHDPLETDLSKRLKPPGTPGHPLGTDELGRDVLSRLLHGTRLSVGIGFLAVLLAMAVGVTLGLAAGYYGGLFDSLAMRGIDVLMAFPYVLLAIAVIAALGPGLTNAMLAIAIAGIPYYARITRSAVLAVREREFIEAERALGNTDRRIVLGHVLPNALSPIIVAATLDVGWMITAAAGLSFLGLGAQPPTPEWGVMLSDGRQFTRVAPHLSLMPGLAIFLVVLALNLLGDGLRDALDPRLKDR